MIILPGLIDIHVHLRTPGQTHKEDFITGTSSAVAGGFTVVLDMPNNTVPIKTKKLLIEKIKIAKKQSIIDVGFYLGSQGDNIEEFDKIKKDVFGIKLYLNETTGNFLINRKTLSKIFKAWPYDAGPILVHAEDDAVSEVIKNVKKTKKHTHFCHISLRSDFVQIMEAKQINLPVTCGVTPHHLFLTNDDGNKLGPYGKMKPCLKPAKDVAFLWNHIDQIDVIESDHAPHTKEEKENSQASKVPFGVPGLETTLPLLITAAHEEKLEIEDIIRLCHDNPKKIFRLPNQDAVIEVDVNNTYEIKNENLFTRCGWSPFAGKKVKGKINKVKIGGKIVYENGKIIAKPGSGRVIKPRI